MSCDYQAGRMYVTFPGYTMVLPKHWSIAAIQNYLRDLEDWLL